jgi:hypothetical protein
VQPFVQQGLAEHAAERAIGLVEHDEMRSAGIAEMTQVAAGHLAHPRIEKARLIAETQAIDQARIG